MNRFRIWNCLVRVYYRSNTRAQFLDSLIKETIIPISDLGVLEDAPRKYSLCTNVVLQR